MSFSAPVTKLTSISCRRSIKGIALSLAIFACALASASASAAPVDTPAIVDAAAPVSATAPVNAAAPVHAATPVHAAAPLAAPSPGGATALNASEPILLAQSGGDAGRSRPLDPTFQPREPEPEGWYNGSYIFALTRSVADSTIAPAGQVPLYVLTVPVDLALLPFALIGGLFG